MKIGSLWILNNSLWKVEASNERVVVLENLYTYNFIEIPIERFEKEAIST